MSGFFNLIICVCAFTHLFYKAECTVTVSEEGGKFLCGHTTKLKCVISPYGGGMTWKLDGTIIAQCAFGSCNPLGALPAGDVFTYDESSGEFFLDIGITHADNGTMYQCDDGSNQHQITVNIAVPPHTGTPITVSGTTLSATAGCFYPANDGKMDIYCVTDGTEILLDTVSMISTGTGCTGDCAGPGIFQATGSATIDNLNGSSAYRFKVYLDGFRDNAYALTDTSSIYKCEPSTTEPPNPVPCCKECCCTIIAFPVVVIIVCVFTLIIVIVLLVVKKVKLDDKVRCRICIVALILCFILAIAVTAYIFTKAGCCCENTTCIRCENCSTKAWPIAATVIIWVLVLIILIIFIIKIVKSKNCCSVDDSSNTNNSEKKTDCPKKNEKTPGKDKWSNSDKKEEKKATRPQPQAPGHPRPQPHPPGQDTTENSDSEVSRKDVLLEHDPVVQKRPRPLPGIKPDKANRGLSANFEDASDSMPSYTAKNYSLAPLPKPEVDEQKKKKKKKRKEEV